jgi:hypothetical protein
MLAKQMNLHWIRQSSELYTYQLALMMKGWVNTRYGCFDGEGGMYFLIVAFWIFATVNGRCGR